MCARLPGSRRLLVALLVLGCSVGAVAAALGAPSGPWRAPQPLGAGTPSEPPAVAVGADGSATAAWIRNGAVVAATRRPRDSWDPTPRRLDPTNPSPQAIDVQVATDPAGDAVIVWSERVADGVALKSVHRSPGGDWTSPQTLASGRGLGLGRLRAGRGGFALLVTGSPPSTLMATPAGEWERARTPLPDDGADQPADIALDATGSLVAAWTLGDKLRTAARARGGGFGAPVKLGWGPVWGARLVNEPSGDVTAIWIADVDELCGSAPARTALRARTRSGGAWSPRVERELCVSVLPETLDADAGPDGSLLAVWRWWPGGGPQVGALLRRGGAWEAKAGSLPGSAGAGPGGPRAVVSAKGVALAVWADDGAAGSAGAVPLAARRAPGGAWQGPQQLADPAAGHGVGVGGVDADARANVLVGWLDSTTGFAYASAFDGEPPAQPAMTEGSGATAEVGQSVAFQATADDSWSSQGDLSFAWNFGDGTTATGASVSHVFTSPGTFSVTVAASDPAGSSPAAATSVTVKARAAGGQASAPDQDHDTIPDVADNCPTVANTDQADADADGLGDVCDTSNTPVALKTVAVKAISGRVYYKPPARVRAARLPAGFRRLRGAATLPLGTTLETTSGRVEVRAAAATRGRATMRGQFFDGRFVVRQLRRAGRGPRARRLVTQLRLAGGRFRSTCSASSRATRSLAAAKPRRKRRHKRVRSLWGDGHGSFQTRGQGAAATVRGTRWLTEDRCDGTLVRVRRGRVDVRDLYRHRTIRVRAGEAYVARRP